MDTIDETRPFKTRDWPVLRVGEGGCWAAFVFLREGDVSEKEEIKQEREESMEDEVDVEEGDDESVTNSQSDNNQNDSRHRIALDAARRIAWIRRIMAARKKKQ